MIFGKTRICTLSAGIESIHHVACLGQLALGCLEVVVAAAVAVQKYHRLAGSFCCIEQADAALEELAVNRYKITMTTNK